MREVFSSQDMKKQFSKANQLLNEKIAGAEKTQYDEEFVELEKTIDTTSLAVDEIITKTNELLQPNPLTRAKQSTAMTVSKMRGQTKNSRYPQPEANLGECFLKFGRDLGENSVFGNGLLEVGEAYKQLADIKDSLDFNVRQNFLDPLDHLRTKELKEISHHRKKMFDEYDGKKRKVQKGSQIPEEEVSMAREKFEESRDIVMNGMANLVDSDVEQVRQLQALVEAQLEFHQQAQDILNQLTSSLGDRIMDAENQPKAYKPRRAVTSTLSSNSHTTTSMDSDDDDDSGVQQISYKPTNPAPAPAAPKYQVCRALYDFEPENEGELPFGEGDNVTIVSEIDENWLEGECNGKSGYFPRNYVDYE
nr:endophilin-A3-like [Lytechinus pictus]